MGIAKNNHDANLGSTEQLLEEMGAISFSEKTGARITKYSSIDEVYQDAPPEIQKKLDDPKIYEYAKEIIKNSKSILDVEENEL